MTLSFLKKKIITMAMMGLRGGMNRKVRPSKKKKKGKKELSKENICEGYMHDNSKKRKL